MRRILRQIGATVTGAGQPPRKRALRAAAVACLVAAVALLSSSLALMLNRPPTRHPLQSGIVFNVPLATVAATPSAVTSAPETPRATETETPVSTPTAEPAESPTAEPSPSPEPTPAPSEAPPARMAIPAIKVNAPITIKGIDAHGVMQDPNSWNDVAYYDFSGRPGFGSGNNAVFAGHVDYIHHGAAVFWDLHKLKPGDEIHIMLADGTEYIYRVTQMAVYHAEQAPVEQILGDTPTESITLITCDGTFAAGHYNNRLVVRAERGDEKPPQDQASGGG